MNGGRLILCADFFILISVHGGEFGQKRKNSIFFTSMYMNKVCIRKNPIPIWTAIFPNVGWKIESQIHDICHQTTKKQENTGHSDQ